MMSASTSEQGVVYGALDLADVVVASRCGVEHSLDDFVEAGLGCVARVLLDQAGGPARIEQDGKGNLGDGSGGRRASMVPAVWLENSSRCRLKPIGRGGMISKSDSGSFKFAGASEPRMSLRALFRWIEHFIVPDL